MDDQLHRAAIGFVDHFEAFARRRLDKAIELVQIEVGPGVTHRQLQDDHPTVH
jgi:hypothetical protein